MSIVNPPPQFTKEVLRQTVRTFAQGSAAQRAAAAAAAQAAASAAAAEAFGVGLFAVYVGSLATGLLLELQQQQITELATKMQLNAAQKTRVNMRCLLDPSVLTRCPGIGTGEFEEISDGLKATRDELNDIYQTMRLVPSLPTWRPFVRRWLYDFTRSFNRMEAIVETGFICRNEPEKVCRERVPGVKQVCIRSVPFIQ